jgi:hypothetical protein
LTTLPSNSKPRVDQGMASAAETVQLTVTGVDTKGQMFRHSATVLHLNGRECTFRSKSQPEMDGSILAEFGYPSAIRRVSQGRVTSNHVEIASGMYKVMVELEVAQPANAVSSAVESQVTAPKPTPPVPQTAKVETDIDSEFTDVEFPPPPKPSGVLRPFPQPNHETNAPVMFENREPRTQTAPPDPEAIRESVKAVVDSEMQEQIQQLKGWISTELEKAVPAILSSNMESMEKMIGEAVEKQVTASHESSIQSLNVDLAKQIGDRIAESADLRSALESMAKRLIEEQTERSQAAGLKIDQQRDSEAAAIIQSFEGPIAEMEARLNAASAKLQQEMDSRAQAIVRAFESSAAQIEAKTDAASARIEKQLNAHADTVIRSFEGPAADMESRLYAASSKVQQELESRAGAIARSLESSAAEIDARIEAAPARIEQQVNVQADKALQTVSESIAQMEARFQAAPARIEQQLHAQADMVLRSLSESIAQMEARMNGVRSEVDAAINKAQSIKQEMDNGILPVQETLSQLNNAERAGIERLQQQVAEQLAAAAAQFENQLNNISAVRTISFVMELDKHLEPHRVRSEEAVDKLGAVLQLVQGTARTQQERLAEMSRTALATFEQEFRALLLRMAGNGE